MSLRSFFSSLAFAALLAGCAANPTSMQTAAADPNDLDPAVWVVKDSDTTVYLFGTFHALDGKKSWFNDEVKASFDKSSELVLEVVTPDDPASMQPLIAKYGIDTSGRTLTSRLSPAGQAALARQLAQFKLPPTALDSFRPFFAALTLANLQFAQMGLEADKGPEATLKQAALAGGKRVGAVESIEFQLSLFNALSEAEQIALLEQSLQDTDAMPAEIAETVDAWGRGDAEKVAELIKRTDAESPALYKMLFVDRNQAWANWIVERMKQPGTVFMAVGAGHLAGSDSVQSDLARRGINSSRVKP